MSNRNRSNLLEKVYTPDILTLELIELLRKHSQEPLEALLEPCSGSGSIVDVLYKEFPKTPVIAYDIFNETKRDDIIEADFLKLDLKYTPGTACITNVPFHLSIKFINKIMAVSDIGIIITGSTTLLSNKMWNSDIFDVVSVHHKKYVPFSDGNRYSINIWALHKKN